MAKRTGDKGGRGSVSRERIQEVAASLRASLLAVVLRVGGESSGAGTRPVALAKMLRIDDSLAARVLRAVRADEALASLRELPAPQGLRLFVEAAARHGVPGSVREPAEAAIRQFEGLIAEMPLGRASLDTAIDGWLPSGRARAERSGKQAVFKALSQTLGFTVDTVCFATAIQPSASGDMCDALTMVAMDGIRRLREGAPILLFGHMWQQAAPPGGVREGVTAPYVETLDGEREVRDARKLLLREVGDSATLPLRMIERGTHTRVVIESSAPALHVPVTAAVGYIERNGYKRYRAGDQRTEVFTNACKVPIRHFVQDFFIHDEVFPGFVPEVVARMDNMTFDPAARDEEMLEIDRLELDVELVRLGRGLGRIRVKEWGGYEPALRGVFERAGWDATRFRAYRCAIRYPYPFVSLATWFDLPARG